jgi:hypothetical protein
MKNDNSSEMADRPNLPGPSSSDLRGKQSVRATFRLSAKAIDAISVVAVHLGIKQKSLFEHLIEDHQALARIARQVQAQVALPENRVQKTFVLSRRTLNLLQGACERFEAPRDALVELIIQRLRPIIEEERERHRRRKALLREVSAYVRHGEALLDKTAEALGPDDPLFLNLRQVVERGQAAEAEIADFVERGKIIESY